MPALQPDDLHPGMFVASPTPLHSIPAGTPLHVAAISLPFLSVQAITPGGISICFPIPSSTPLQPLTSTYVASFFPPRATPDSTLLRGREILTPPLLLPDPSHGNLPPS